MMLSLVLLMALLLSCSSISGAARLLEEAAPKEEYPHPATPELPKPELPPRAPHGAGAAQASGT